MKTQIREKLIGFGIHSGDTVGAAVSGGVDSMVLLDVLCNLREELNIIVVAYHFEHGIRAQASVNDMRFVEKQCMQRNVSCVTGREDVLRLAKETGASVETAARNARYAFLDAQQADWIATAHHEGDMAETVVMNLCRGSGMKGLCGIPERRGRYLRPMLDSPRDAIERYAADNGIEFVTDSTNDDTAYTRNYVRAEVLPRLKTVNAQALRHIASAAKLLAEDEEALIEIAKAAGGIEKTADNGVLVDMGVLMDQPVAVRKRMIRLALQMGGGLHDISQGHIDDVLMLAEKKVSGKQIELPDNVAAVVEYGHLRIGKRARGKGGYSPVSFEGPGHYLIDGVELWCETGLRVREPKTECFDTDGLNGACFRHRLEGDYIRPLGMQGQKRLSDYLSDRKVPLAKRDFLVVLAKDSEVFWVVGVGVSETTKAHDDAQCYILRYGEKQNA